MRLSREEQKRMLDRVISEYQLAKKHGWFKDWYCVASFDRHSPCENICFTTPSGTEIKVFIPNSTDYCEYSEQFNSIDVWISDMGPDEFANEEVLIDYFLEQEQKKLI